MEPDLCSYSIVGLGPVERPAPYFVIEHIFDDKDVAHRIIEVDLGYQIGNQGPMCLERFDLMACPVGSHRPPLARHPDVWQRLLDVKTPPVFIF